MKQFLNRVGNDYPSAIFCTNDEMAMGAIRAIQERDLKVPEHIAVVGFDDINVSQFLILPLQQLEYQENNGESLQQKQCLK